MLLVTLAIFGLNHSAVKAILNAPATRSIVPEASRRADFVPAVPLTQPSPNASERSGAAAAPRAGPDLWEGSPALQEMAAMPPAQRQIIREGLVGATAKYERMLEAGKSSLGNVQYADIEALDAALVHAASPAARFKLWRVESRIDSDIGFEGAHQQAYEIYAQYGAPMPESVDDWLENMGDLQIALLAWANLAEEWQARNEIDGSLSAAEKAVRDALARALALAQSP
jgi:hypothetical protein